MAPPEFILSVCYSLTFISNTSCLYKGLLRLALNHLQVHKSQQPPIQPFVSTGDRQSKPLFAQQFRNGQVCVAESIHNGLRGVKFGSCGKAGGRRRHELCKRQAQVSWPRYASYTADRASLPASNNYAWHANAFGCKDTRLAARNKDAVLHVAPNVF